MLWPSPSRRPSNGAPKAPIGAKPAPLFHVAVAVASMLLPRAYFPVRPPLTPCKSVAVVLPASLPPPQVLQALQGLRARGGPVLVCLAQGAAAGAAVQQALARRYGDLFAVYVKHRAVIDRVTFWGVADGDSWLNGWPVRGRTNHPLLFDRQHRPKPAFDAVIRAARTARAPVM